MFERALASSTHDEQFDACLLLDRYAAVVLKLVPLRYTENLTSATPLDLPSAQKTSSSSSLYAKIMVRNKHDSI